ncbi:MAG: hypothetical protein ACFFHV_19085 [Promethearchaeota archaeon]
MDFNDLSQTEILEGTFSLIFVILSLIIGTLFIVRYISNRQIEFVTIGLTWVFLSSGWWGSAFSFLTILLFNTPLTLFQYLFISNVFLPLVLIVWIYSFCHTIYPHLEKLGLIITLLIVIPFEIVLIILLFTNPQSIGRFEGIFNVVSSPFLQVFEILLILTTLITGLIFSIKSMKVDDSSIKWRGRLLLIAFVLLTIAGLLDSLIIGGPLFLVLTRFVLISSAIIYYLAFFFRRQ